MVLCEDIELHGFSTRAVEKLVKFTREVDSQLKNARVAIVTTQRPIYGLVRMFQIIRRPSFELALFKDAQTARRWLASPREGRDPA